MKIILAGCILGKGGVQTHLKWLTKALEEEKMEIVILSLEEEDSDSSTLSYFKYFREDKVKICFVNSSIKPKANSITIQKINTFLEIKKTIDEFKPNIYLAVGVGWNLFFPGLLIKGKVKTIFHEVMSGVPWSWKDPRWGVRLWFDEVVGQSTTVAQNFSKHFGWRKYIKPLPALPEPLEITAKLSHPVKRKIEYGIAKAAFFSRLAPHKQAFWLVQQWSILKEFLGELHIHGTGDEALLIQNYIEETGIGERVKYCGPYPDGQAYVDLLSGYDLTLLPTIGLEGAPLVLLESMACGVPFVAYGVGGIPDYGVNNPNVLVVPPHPEDFITGIKQMVELLDAGEIDQEQLQQFYLENYSYSVLKHEWLSYLYRQKQ